MGHALREIMSLRGRLIALAVGAPIAAHSGVGYAGEPRASKPVPSSEAPWRHAASAHLVGSPLYIGVLGRIVHWYEQPPSISNWSTIGLRVDYLYRFGAVRIGAGLRHTASTFDEVFGWLQESSLPILFSTMGTFESGVELGVTIVAGPGVALAYVSDFRYETYTFLPPIWHAGFIGHADILLSVAVPLADGYDLSFRGGVSGAMPAIFRLSTPVEIGIQKRW